MRREFETLSRLIVCGILTCVPVCRGGGRDSEATSENEAAVLGEETARLLLPEGWLAEYVAQRQAPAQFQAPVGERWRFTKPSGPITAYPYPCVAVSGPFVFLGYATHDPSEDLAQWQEQRKAGSTEPPKMLYTTECRDIASGAVLWSVDGLAGGMTVLPGYLLMTCPGKNGLELAILDTNKRKIVRRIPYDTNMEEAAQRSMEENRRFKQLEAQNPSVDFAEIWALDVRQRLLPCIFSDAAAPVSLDMAEWTPGDMRLLMDILRTAGDSVHLMQYGALKGNLLFPDRENVFVIGTTHNLTYRSSLEERIHWRQICTAGTRDDLLWRPPYVAVFSSPTAVTAYRIEDGHPAWMYEFPADTSNGGPVYRFASLTDGILLLTEPLVGLSDSEYGSRLRREPQNPPKRSKYLWLTKLDPEGKRLYQQELTMKSSYQKFAISEGCLLLWTHNELVCYGPTDETPRTVPPDQKPAMAEEQRQLEIERLHAEYDKFDPGIYERRRVCHELGRLKDRSMLQRVLADLGQADERGKDIYVEALGFLNDRRAIDSLISLLKDESWSVRTKVTLSLTRLTGVGDLFPTEWEPWWNAHKYLYQEDGQ